MASNQLPDSGLKKVIDGIAAERKNKLPPTKANSNKAIVASARQVAQQLAAYIDGHRIVK